MKQVECDLPFSRRTFWVTMVWSGSETKTPATQRRVHRIQTLVQVDLALQTLGSLVISAKVYFHPHTDCVSCAGLSPNGGFQMNFDLVLRRIRELNVLAGEGESFVQTTGTGAKLAKKDPIQLKLYRNGIVMFDGPFRSYQEHSTQVSFLHLRSKHPALYWTGWFLKYRVFFLIFTAMHARFNGWLLSIWASAEISRRRTFRGAFLQHFLHLQTSWYLTGNPLSRFMTVEMKNSWPGCHGTRFLVTDKQFVGRNRQIPSALTQVWSELVTVRIGHNIYIFFFLVGVLIHREEADHRSVPQQAAKGGSKGRERVQHQGFPEENSAGEQQRSIIYADKPKPLLNTPVLSSGSFWCAEQQLRDSHWHTSAPSNDGEVNKVTEMRSSLCSVQIFCRSCFYEGSPCLKGWRNWLLHSRILCWSLIKFWFAHDDWRRRFWGLLQALMWKMGQADLEQLGIMFDDSSSSSRNTSLLLNRKRFQF